MEPVKKSKGLFLQIGALSTALLASACCWLPLVLLAFGISGGALAGKAEAFRPFLLFITFGFLALAFYVTYGKSWRHKNPSQEACCLKEGSQKRKIPWLQRFHKVMLWMVTLFVLIFAFFPSFIGFLFGSGKVPPSKKGLQKVEVKIQGMTCQACAVNIQKHLQKVPEVVDSSVSFEKGKGVLYIPEGKKIPRETILKAITSAGPYKGYFLDQKQWILMVRGMTCQGCAIGIQKALSRIPGVQKASVSYEEGKAEVITDPSVKEETLRKGITQLGYQVTEVKYQ